LYSNPGETVFSPFAGIGSEGYAALKLGRKFYGTELKKEYFETAKKNLASVVTEQTSTKSLFDDVDADDPVNKSFIVEPGTPGSVKLTAAGLAAAMPYCGDEE
jgi:tRNA/tmRNA/rRNA uracil-C5-methylase (TrmA/RlmC/RlmD family)